MIDLEILAEYGLTHENLKKWFDEDPKSFGALPKAQQESITKLREHFRNRIRNGRDWNLTRHTVYHALDLAWDTPFRQITPTLLQSLGMDVVDEKGVIESKLKSWGIDPTLVISEVPDPKSKGKSIKRVNVSNFSQIFVSLVRSYGTIRWAKIINDRRLVPFFKYEPAIDTKQNRLRCDIVTNRIEVMARQMGYFETMKQCVFQMLHYGLCLQFPAEEWYKEEQLVRPAKSEKPKSNEKTEVVSLMEDQPAEPTTEEAKPNTKKVVVKEGVRYETSHPTRVFWDQSHRLSTFNSDTGCEYAGYWRILRFRDIYSNPDYWNKDLIPTGNTDWWSGASAYFNTVYRCTINFPTIPTAVGGTKDRETNQVTNFYSGANNLDHTIMFTEYFEKIVPKAWGLGTYEHPVWFRFVVAGDTGTVIYAAPLPYCPVIAYMYDSDEQRDQNASLSLEILPYQDQFSNLLSQYLLTVQHNLANVTMFDKDQIEEKYIDEIENKWASKWIRRTIVRFSGRRSMKAQQTVPNAVASLNMQPLDSNGIIAAMKIILDTLERVLVMSSQEVAQAASHEQTREEIRNLQDSTSSRLTFTTTPVDLAGEAWKRQLYAGLMSYGDAGFYAQVPFETPLDKKTIEDLGFTVEEKGSDEDRMKERKVTIRVKDKTAIAIEAFASSRDGNDRINNVESAAAMATFVRDVVNGPYGQTIGPDQFIRICNEISRLAGFPRDFKLVNKAPADADLSPEKQKEEQKKQLDAIIQACEQVITPKVFKAIEKPLDDLAKADEALAKAMAETQAGVKESLEMDIGQSEAIKTLGATVEHLQAALGVSPMPPQEPPPEPPLTVPPPMA